MVENVRPMVKAVVEGFGDHDLWFKSSGLAFRVLLALVPGILCLVGLLGLFDLEEAWTEEVAPELEGEVSPQAYHLINDTVQQVLGEQQLFWVTLGAAIAVWQLSGLVRGVGSVIDELHGTEQERGEGERIGISVAVGAAIGMLILAAVAVIHLLPLALAALSAEGWFADVVGFALRWSIAAALLLGVVSLLTRQGSEMERRIRDTTRGAVIVVAGWVAASLGFGLYLTEIANYGSVFGNLATFYILFQYLYMLAVIFVAGALIDREVGHG